MAKRGKGSGKRTQSGETRTPTAVQEPVVVTEVPKEEEPRITKVIMTEAERYAHDSQVEAMKKTFMYNIKNGSIVHLNPGDMKTLLIALGEAADAS